MSRTRRSLTIIFFSSNAVTVVNFVVSLILARLLDPADIGIFSMTAVFVNIAHTFRDFGVSTYLQREKDLTPEKIRSASGLLFCSSWAMALILWLCSGPVAHFYNQPGVAEVIRVLAIGFCLIPFASVTHSLLRRNLEAEKQAIVMAVGTTAYAAACIGFALAGFGYMSLAWANLVNIIATIIGYLPFRPKGLPWLPSMRNWKGIARFGGGAVLGSLVTNINSSLPDILLGKKMNAYSVGIYSRSNSLVELFSYVAMPAINNMAVPYIAQNYHGERPLSPMLCKAMSYLSGLAWPVLAVTAFHAEDMIRLLYGPKWLECVPLVGVMCLASAARIPFSLTQNGLIAVGRPYLSVLPAMSTLAMRLGLALLLQAHDLFWFACIFLIADVVTLPVVTAIWQKTFNVKMSEMARALVPSAGVTLACVAVSLALLRLPGDWLPVARLLVVGMACGITWLLAIKMLKHPLNAEIDMVLAKLWRRQAA
ncbi:MAG: lipopolysaccharide biosynthesis protein [Rhodocyclales bacterium]|nr:lipopolysaccharide biosynthesis protein [Rhodocyclales bacterium]